MADYTDYREVIMKNGGSSMIYKKRAWLPALTVTIMVAALVGCSKTPETMCRDAADKVAELSVKDSIGKNASEALISRRAGSLKNNSTLMRQCEKTATQQRYTCVMNSDSVFQARTACDWVWVQKTSD